MYVRITKIRPLSGGWWSRPHYNRGMFPRLSDVIAAINDLKERGVIKDYAVAGAFALSVWDEVRATFDLDVLILPPTSDGLLTEN